MIYFPFDSVVSDDGQGNLSYDREFNSANLRKIFHGLYTNGVAMSDNSAALQVSPVSGLNVSVGTGFVIIEGAMGCLESAEAVAVDAAHETYTRIDSIMVRLNTNTSGRCISIEYVKGTPASAPSAPELVRAGGIYDLRLANIRIPAGTDVITGSMITDMRLSGDCGIATARPEQVSTVSIFNQYQAALTEYMQYVQDCINETVAGQLQTQIDNMQDAEVEGSLAAQLAAINTTLTNINTSLTNQNALLTELASARNVRTLGGSFRFNNSNWTVDSVYCVGKIVILMGHLSAPWNTTDNVKWSTKDANTVKLACPAGYRPVAAAELLFGGKTSSYNGDKTCFELKTSVLETKANGDTLHLVYGYAQSLRGTHNYNFQFIYVRNGAVSA